MDRKPLTEIGVAALIALISAVFLVQALALPPGRFEPLGSGPVPIWTAVIVIACCLVVILRATLSLRGTGIARAAHAEFSGGYPMGGAMMMGLTVTYVGALQLKLVGFGIATFVFLWLMILSMDRFNRRRILPATILSAVAAFGAQYVFTKIFVVDLPV